MFCDPAIKNPTYIYLWQKVVLKNTKTPKIAATVLWSCQQKSNIYIFFPKSRLRNTKTPKSKQEHRTQNTFQIWMPEVQGVKQVLTGPFYRLQVLNRS